MKTRKPRRKRKRTTMLYLKSRLFGEYYIFKPEYRRKTSYNLLKSKA